MSLLVTGSTGESILRQRNCPRDACAIPAPPRSESCCDDSCLVEIARRECNKEGSHYETILEDTSKTLQNEEESPDKDKSIATKSHPCKTHCQKTKKKYGAFLDNLGCICKILLSLNIEPCCIIPTHATAPSRPSQNAINQRDSPPSCHPTSALAMQAPDDCSKRGCCGTIESSEIVVKVDPVGMTTHDYLEEDGCANNSSKAIANVPSKLSPHNQDYLSSGDKKRRGVLVTKKLEAENTPPEMICYQRGCCDDTSSKTSQENNPAVPEQEQCATSSCCDNTSLSASPANAIENRSCSSKAVGDIDSQKEASAVNENDGKGHHKRGTSRLLHPKPNNVSSKCCGGGSCQSSADERIVPVLVTSKDTKRIDNGLDGISINEHNDVDVEAASNGIEHHLIRVQGMDCTGCEKKLYRSLAKLTELSNIKTSLLLAQAEFDLLPSNYINKDTIGSTIERMTGFRCTKITHSGAELELVVEGNPMDFLEDWPTGVKEITVLTKHSIQVSYQPQIVGARDLLQDPFFQRARLASPSAPPLVAFGRAHVLKTFLLTLISAILTIPVLVLAWSPLPRHEVLYGAISLALATIVQTAVAGQFYIKTIKALVFSRMIDMDLLIVLSSSTAYVYSVIAYGHLVAGKPLGIGEFFETSTLLVTLIMVGRTVSEYARNKAVESITVESLQTPTALLVGENLKEDMEIDARLLQYEDTFKVLPDMSIVTDGVVLSGKSEVDESMITGEATLIAKIPGTSVVAGSVNHSGSLLVTVTRLPCENTIKTIGAMVDEAKSSKPKVQETADRVASYFVPAILGVSLMVFVVWIAIGKIARHQSLAVAAINAMTFAISVLIVSCPCAIGLAVPMVVVIAGGVAARRGLIFKTAETIDIGRKISHVVFDKTGTLTQGKLHVVAEEYLNGERSQLASMILGLTINSKHPVSKALVTHLLGQNIQPLDVENLNSIAGNGVEASHTGLAIRAGNPYWLGVEHHPSVRQVLEIGATMFCVTLDNKLVAVFGLQDQLRPDALETITELKKRSIAFSIISGDNEAAVNTVATQLDIPSSNIRFRYSPEDKQAYVKSLLDASDHASDRNHNHNQLHFHKHKHAHSATVLFIGDGTNDAPSLAQASIGLHMSEGGTDVASSAANVVLMRPSLLGIITLIDLSKAFQRRVVFNFAWSFVYNLAAVLLAAGVGGKVRIPPQYAGLGEVVSVVPVVAVAIGLRWWKG